MTRECGPPGRYSSEASQGRKGYNFIFDFHFPLPFPFSFTYPPSFPGIQGLPLSSRHKGYQPRYSAAAAASFAPGTSKVDPETAAHWRNDQEEEGRSWSSAEEVRRRGVAAPRRHGAVLESRGRRGRGSLQGQGGFYYCSVGFLGLFFACWLCRTPVGFSSIYLLPLALVRSTTRCCDFPVSYSDSSPSKLI